MTETQLSKLYYEPASPASYGGVEKLFREARKHGIDVTRRKVSKFLESQNAYTFHKPIRHKFIRNKTIVGGIDEQWQADLADMNEIVKDNDGYRYLLNVIDCFSRYAWAVPMKSKSASEMVDALTRLFNEVTKPRKPRKLQTDKGKEFLNKQVQDLLKQYDIIHFTTDSDTKASMAERFNRTLKTKIFSFLTANRTHRYIDVLSSLVKAYNHTRHRSIGMRPIDVNKRNERKLWVHLYGQVVSSAPDSVKSVYQPDTSVRISKLKTTFEKGYKPNWTGEFFKVIKGQKTPGGRLVYKIRDIAGEDIGGSFYPEELQKISKNDDDDYEVENIIKSRSLKNGNKEYLVKWKHWPRKFNSWVTEGDIANG